MLFRPELLLPFLLFSFVAFFTPGPNNLLLLTSGLNFGLRRTWPAMLGVFMGYAFLALCLGLGLGVLFIQFPILYVVLKYGGAVYMLYLAWAIAWSKPPNPDTMDKTKQPLTFFKVAMLQWVNPKGWAMGVGAISSYSAIAAFPYNILLMVAFFIVIGCASSIAWAGLGLVMQKFLHRPKIVRAFNVTMALLLVASLYPVVADIWK